jgi:hypothetical protein
MSPRGWLVGESSAAAARSPLSFRLLFFMVLVLVLVLFLFLIVVVVDLTSHLTILTFMTAIAFAVRYTITRAVLSVLSLARPVLHLKDWILCSVFLPTPIRYLKRHCDPRQEGNPRAHPHRNVTRQARG